ncbi:elongation factor P 5-aminopentanone reductase [Candidatus Pseudoscillospira sp. SGI.172]|uniref:elongation factor P 5-aminopentanone reductase n=1 Tax=Candidatus Pseudoscillospira sp. SGI.172 TaxID=3420582 RepID=UPI002A78A0E3|nr:3-oxoacyl-ACP reductase FabG [Pseudoflavonifractor sp.]MDY3019740.1 3-oxoacyl-ACP reductase FabG [Oscillospiraceae bacterium]
MKTALVTGGSRGIGAAVARRLAADGYRVAVNYHFARAQAESLAEELGGIAVQADVSDSAQVQKMVDTVLEKFCQLDILVCNAGVAWQGLLQDMRDEEWRKVLGTDLDGVFFCCRAVLPHMIGQKSGKIVTMSSMWGQVGASCEAAYSAAKAGVIGLTRALAKEVGPSGISVNCVAPGVIDTEMNQKLGQEALAELAEETPLGRLGTAADVAGCVSFLCSPAADFVTGQVLSANGGLVI